MIKYEPMRNLIKEVKVRCFYLITSFCLSFFLCYQNSTQIVYLMVKPSYRHNQTTCTASFTEKQDRYVGIIGNTPLLPETQHNPTLLQDNVNNPLRSLDFTYNFIYTNITEAFYATLQASCLISIMFCLPLVVYHCWCFLMPSRYSRERNNINKLIIFCFGYMVVSFCLILYGLVPHIGLFLHNFAVTTGKLQIINQARIYPYISWLFYTVVNLFLVSLVPIAMYLTLKTKLIKLSKLLKNRKISFLVMLMLGALVSPPDLTSQICLTLCLFVFSECVIWVYLYNTLDSR